MLQNENTIVLFVSIEKKLYQNEYPLNVSAKRVCNPALRNIHLDIAIK